MRHVSVVIPTYNRAHLVAHTINSALAQTHPAVEVIVVDDGSTDATPETLLQFGQRIRVVRQENRGVAAARNRGAAEARGDFVLFLDSDDVLAPSCVEKQLARFESEAGLGLVYTDLEVVDGEGRTVRIVASGQEGHVAPELLRLEREVLHTPGSGVLIPKRVFQEAGGFDERISVSEDWDLCYRIASKHPIGRVPEVLMRYRSAPDGLHANIPAMEHGMLLAFRKAFSSTTDPGQLALRRRAYARLHFILAGCYFAGRRTRRGVVHLFRSASWHPALFARLFLARILRDF